MWCRIFSRVGSRVGRRVVMVLGPSAGGIRRHVAYLTDEMRARDWDVTTVGPAGVLDGLATLDHALPVAAGPGALFAGRQFQQLAADADVVHAHGLSAAFVATLPRKSRPTVMTVHNVVLDSAGRKAAVLRLLEKRLPSRVDATITVSADIASSLGCATARVIPAPGPPPRPTIAPHEVRERYGIAADAPLCVTVARLHPQKGLPVWIDALARMRSQVPGIRALLVGDGPDRETLRSQATEAGLDDVVVWAGAVPDASNELAAADVIVIPSLWEGSPLVVAEAMSLGRPVVATAVGTVGEWMQPDTGWLVEAGDATALLGAVEHALTDRARAVAMGRNARERFLALDVAQSAFDDIARVYDEVRV